MTGGSEINFGGHENFILCEFERGKGAGEIYPGLVQIKMVRSKDSKGFSGRKRKFKRYFRPKTGDLQKKKSSLILRGIFWPQSEKKRSSSQKRHEIRCQSTKNTIWAWICTPVAPSLLISSGHSHRLGGRNFRLGGAQAVIWGGTAPVCPPVAPGLESCYRKNDYFQKTFEEYYHGLVSFFFSIIFE